MSAATTPTLPGVGDFITVLGVCFRVTVVEPQSDWFWSIEAENGEAETLRMLVPSGDRRTTDA